MSRRFATVVTLVIVVAFVVVAVAPAFAAAPASLVLHARIQGSTPKDGSTVGTAEEVVLAFNEEVDPTFVQVTVAGPDGSETAGPPAVAGREVTQALSSELPAGEHLVTYRVVSTDGHPVSGTVTFTTTAAPSASAEPSASASAEPTASASAGPTASATPSPSLTPAAAPTSDDSVPAWAGLLIGLGAVLSVLALTISWRHLGGPEDDAEADAAADAREAGDVEDDPLRAGVDDARGPFA